MKQEVFLKKLDDFRKIGFWLFGTIVINKMKIFLPILNSYLWYYFNAPPPLK